MLKRRAAELFGALPGGAVGIEANVGIQVLERSLINFSAKMDYKIRKGIPGNSGNASKGKRHLNQQGKTGAERGSKRPPKKINPTPREVK